MFGICMASGSVIGEGGNEGSKEKQRVVEIKVYTRRVFKDLKKNVGSITAAPSASPAAPLVVTTTLSAKTVVAATSTLPLNGIVGATVTGATPPVDRTTATEHPGTVLVDATMATNTSAFPLVDPGSATTVPAEATPCSSLIVRAPGGTSPVVLTAGATSPVDAAAGPTSRVDTAADTVAGAICLVDTAATTSVPAENNSVDNVGPTASPVTVDASSTAATTSIAAGDTAAIDHVAIVTVSMNKMETESGHGNQINKTQTPKPLVCALEDKVLGQREPVCHLNSPSDDFNNCHRHQDIVVRSAQDFNASNGEKNRGVVNRVKINLALKSKHGRRELRGKLQSELDLLRGLARRVEAEDLQHGFSGISSLWVSVNDGIESGMRRASLDPITVSFPLESATLIAAPTAMQSRSFSQISVSVMDNGRGFGEIMEKERRTLKANPLYKNSEFLLAKDKFPPAESNKKMKLNGKRHGRESGLGFGPSSKVFKNCNTLLEKLMKHKHGWVFNSPVDAEALCLNDYHSIIEHPMDLGTVKSRLNRNWYKAPQEFAEDVRLTFHNALTYNPKGQDVHIMAEQLLKIFEDKWDVMKSDFDGEMHLTAFYHVGVTTPPSRKSLPLLQVVPLDMSRILDRSEPMTYASFEGRPKLISTSPSSRTAAPKKPKAKDLNKRDMTYEEKQTLSTNLQNLPSEKLDNVVQIIKKRNSTLSQHDDEIEVHIDSVDTETLWELDRFVTNYKKSVSKNKRKAELAMLARAEAVKNVQWKIPEPNVVEVPKENITSTDDRIISVASPVQADKQGYDGSRSSGSSSSSSDLDSSSTDSDSSSIASGSDVRH